MSRREMSQTSWEQRKWAPVVGMRIWYRRDVSLPVGATNGQFATILVVGDDGIVRIQRSHNNRITHLGPQTWKTSWEPCEQALKTHGVPCSIAEQDVRRIVREELKAIFG